MRRFKRENNKGTAADSTNRTSECGPGASAALSQARRPQLDLPGEQSVTPYTHSLTPTHSNLPGTSTSGPLHKFCASMRSFLPLQVIQSLPSVTWEGPSLCTMNEAPPTALVIRPLPGPHHTQGHCPLPAPGLLACRTDAEPAS